MDNEKNNIPKHVAIIMDGNGRWAKKNGLSRSKGHQKGAENVVKITSFAWNKGIKYLTLYAFSTENWKRSSEEVSFLMNLFSSFLDNYIEEFLQKGIQLRVIGDLEQLPFLLKKKFKKAIKESQNNSAGVLQLAINYGGRNELVSAIQAISEKVKKEEIQISDINEKLVSAHLYSPDVPDPDLLIRTSGEYRISNFLNWQISYSEIYITEVLWPDFDEHCLELAIQEYQNRNRRYGGY